MTTRPAIARIAACLAAAGFVGALALAAPTSAGAAPGVFVWTGSGGDTPIPFPTDDQCYATPGGTGAQNFTPADAFFYVDPACTITMEAGNAGPFSGFANAFESVVLRTSMN